MKLINWYRNLSSSIALLIRSLLVSVPWILGTLLSVHIKSLISVDTDINPIIFWLISYTVLITIIVLISKYLQDKLAEKENAIFKQKECIHQAYTLTERALISKSDTFVNSFNKNHSINYLDFSSIEHIQILINSMYNSLSHSRFGYEFVV